MQLLFLGGGLWIISVLLVVGGVIFVGQAAKASKSNSTTEIPGKGWKDNTGNVKITSLAKFWIGVALFVFAAAALLLMYNDR